MRMVMMVAALMATGSCERVTQGDLRDMEAADKVVECARRMLPPTQGDTEAQIWQTCLQAVSNTERRDVDRVAARVIRAEGNVFSE